MRKVLLRKFVSCLMPVLTKYKAFAHIAFLDSCA